MDWKSYDGVFKWILAGLLKKKQNTQVNDNKDVIIWEKRGEKD